jgi:DNA polymerase III subunit chi
MTQVDFHFNATDKLHYVCRLLRKIYKSGKKTVVYCGDGPQLTQLDQALWSFSPLDFLPHVRAGDALASATPIILLNQASDTAQLAATHHDVLVNLGRDMPPMFSRFDRLVEVVEEAEEDRLQARVRWKFYKDRGYPLNTYDLSKQAG